MSSAPSVDPRDYPPYTMTDAQAAATVGRYVEDLTPAQVPNLTVDAPELKAGRTPAAPPGVVYVGDVYEPNESEEISPHVASVAAYPEEVRSSVPDAIDPAAPGVAEAAAALAPESVSETHEELVAIDTAAKAEDEREAAGERVELADEAYAEGVEVPELEAAAEAKANDADEATSIAEAAEAVAELQPEIGQDTDNAEPAKATVDYSEFTVAQLRQELGNRGQDYEYSARKADLIKQLEALG